VFQPVNQTLFEMNAETLLVGATLIFTAADAIALPLQPQHYHLIMMQC
jgi:hypothetical protein